MSLGIVLTIFGPQQDSLGIHLHVDLGNKIGRMHFLCPPSSLKSQESVLRQKLGTFREESDYSQNQCGLFRVSIFTILLY